MTCEHSFDPSSGGDWLLPECAGGVFFYRSQRLRPRCVDRSRWIELIQKMKNKKKNLNRSDLKLDPPPEKTRIGFYLVYLVST